MRLNIYTLGMMSPQALLKSLSDPTRLRMVLLLARNSRVELCVCDLMSVLDMDQPKISRHLAILRKGEVLVSRKSGQWVYYKINDALPAWAVSVLGNLLEGSQNVKQYSLDTKKLENTKVTC